MREVFFTVLGISVMCSLIILIVEAVDKIAGRNYSRRWKYIIWAIVAIRLVFPINIQLFDVPLSFSVLPVLDQRMPVTLSRGAAQSSLIQAPVTENQTPAKNRETGTVPAQKNDLVSTSGTNGVLAADGQRVDKNDTDLSFAEPIWYGLTGIWVAGVVLFLLYHVFSYLHFCRKLQRWGSPVKNQEIQEMFQKLCEEMGIKRKITLINCEGISSPMLMGFLKPNIILPKREFTMEQYAFILRHELIHFMHGDLYYKMLLLCSNSIHWFNPAVYYFTHAANSDLELYCDETLVSKSDLNYRENYSMTLLLVMANAAKNHVLLSTSFGGRKKQVKKRFYQIMNGRPIKKGSFILAGLIGTILILGNLAAGQTVTEKSSEEKIEITETNEKQAEQSKQILLVGIDETEENTGYAQADSILLVTLNPVTEKITLTSFLRDLYVEIPGQGKDKLGSSYRLGGTKLLKETMETNFDLTIERTVTVNMDGFASMIDTLGGVELELSQEEADYLNKSNYISDRTYRTLVAGKQRLNGNQAIGYVRVRHVPAVSGESGDLGRTSRIRTLLSAVIQEAGGKDLDEIIRFVSDMAVYVVTDFGYEEIPAYLNTAMKLDRSIQSVSIPVEDSFQVQQMDNKSVLVPDLEKNIEVLKQNSHIGD